ncbi:LacI family DNA-binding transcriptional regulator [Winogradskyella bathintestinalis]|uniref:LacI family DNA-binding transcriptional regulator n=1 Tax=Winogradskyella bathintestinalis TaxID=3035208 RepID=A0ABT7ZZ80_9FLAO|nr:LacI family DNA-binding transcriptional regulator [Winogradskyella bathintestinalis]MDN3494139.1 LacI family DNA-binding transcriptional regulator [Winogradskyella bathintestinalis]
MTTLKELAALLNISVSTVSKALNDSHEISEKTRVRVKELATKLNYKPNRIAQQLKSSKTKVIGVIVPSLMNPFIAEVVHAIEMTLDKNNYDMSLCISNENLKKEQRSVELLSNGSVDGFIVAVARETQIKNKIEHFENVNKSTPVVMFDRVINEIECDKVVVDDFQSVYETSRYLIDKEKREHILLISNIEELSVGKYRIDGYTKAVKESNLKVSVLKLGGIVNPDVKIYDYLKLNPKIDAIISIDHITGIMALNMLKKLGKEIPTEISVIGFGYSDAQFVSNPKISVINQKAREIGEITTKIMLEKIKGFKDRDLKTIVIPSEIILRESTK